MTGVFWVTSSCNLKCIYCYEGNNKNNLFISKEIINYSVDFLFKIMKENDDKKLSVTIHGGEPFLAFDLIKYLVEVIKRRSLDFGVELSFICTTNGTILNDEMIKFISKEIKNISISLDGKKDTQNYTRPYKNGQGTHEIVEKNLKKLLKILPFLRVRLTYNRETVYNLFENIKYLIDLGVKCIVPARDFFDKKFGNMELEALSNELLKIKRYIKGKSDVNIALLDKKSNNKLGICGGGINSFNFDPSGNIYPCTITVGHKEFIIGNVFEGIDIKKRNEIASYSLMKNEECIGCYLYSYCEQTRCKMINKILTGDYCKASPVDCMEKNVLCDVNFKNE